MYNKCNQSYVKLDYACKSHNDIYLVLIKKLYLFLSKTRRGYSVQRWIVCPLSLLQLCQVQSTFRQSHHYGQSQLNSSQNKTDTPEQSFHMFSLHSIMISCTMHIPVVLINLNYIHVLITGNWFSWQNQDINKNDK